jgi:hypothetical protein
MAKKAATPPTIGHNDYEPSYDPTDHSAHPHGGYRGRETRGGLGERKGFCEPTQTRGDVFHVGSMHSNRTHVGGADAPRQLRAATVEDGVTFSERLRTDLDEDISQW